MKGQLDSKEDERAVGTPGDKERACVIPSILCILCQHDYFKHARLKCLYPTCYSLHAAVHVLQPTSYMLRPKRYSLLLDEFPAHAAKGLAMKNNSLAVEL